MVAIMSTRTDRTGALLFWTPRVLAILFALFVSLFALDVLGASVSMWETAIALSIHLIPTALVLILLAAAWQREWIGAFGYTTLAFMYLMMAWGRFHWSAYVAIAGPLFLISFMFLIGWLNRSRLRSSP